MSNSSLVSYTKISPHRSSPRNHVIDTITIHCYVAQVTAKVMCDNFYRPASQASANYNVGCDGSIGQSCYEEDRSWCTSSASNDNRAITIEVASDTFHPYAVTDAAYNSLINLLVDICRRNGIPRLLWQADPSLIGQVDKQNMTVHRWFYNKACPGQYLYERHGAIASAVNARLRAEDNSNPKQIWDYFMERIGNEYGVAGLMGNLEAESGLHPDRVQGDIPYTSYSVEYTAKVDNGTISKNDFIFNGPGGGGYGLAQWTYWSRKQALYERWERNKGQYTSIGALNLAMDYLWYELEHDFPGVLLVLKNATSVRQASDKVLEDFENPANQSEAVHNIRCDMCQAWYNRYCGSDPTPNPNPPGTGWLPGLDNAGRRRKMPLLLMLAAGRRR